MTACVNSWPSTSTGLVNRSKTSPVTVAEDQLRAVPERVVVVPLVVHGRHHRRAGIVVGVAAVDLAEQRQRRGHAVGRLVDRDVAGSARRPASAPACRAARRRCGRCAPPRRARRGRRRRTVGALQPDARRRGPASARPTRRPRGGSARSGAAGRAGRSRPRHQSRRHPVGRETAGGDRSPALGGDPDQRLALRRIAARYSSQSGCSPEMQRKYSTSPSSASWLGHVEHLGGAVDLHPRVVPLVGVHEHAAAGRGAGSWPWRGRGTSRSRSGPRRRRRR